MPAIAPQLAHEIKSLGRTLSELLCNRHSEMCMSVLEQLHVHRHLHRTTHHQDEQNGKQILNLLQTSCGQVENVLIEAIGTQLQQGHPLPRSRSLQAECSISKKHTRSNESAICAR